MENDFLEIDFIKITTDNNADAITMRYSINNEVIIHVVDAGYEQNGQDLVDHIKKNYGSNSKINHLVLTHPDKDHISGMKKIIENFNIGTLWMNRPWRHIDYLYKHASRYTNIENFEQRLRDDYKSLNDLEKIALSKNIEIQDIFAGHCIGKFIVLSPSKSFYLDMLVQSDKNKELQQENDSSYLLEHSKSITQKITKYIKSIWGMELFPNENTSEENETSVIQYLNFNNECEILLTGDAGKLALQKAIDFNPEIFPFNGKKINLFQIPHHGSRRNISSEILDSLFGKKAQNKKNLFWAVASVSSETKSHPKKAVNRALQHRGGSVFTNKTGFHWGTPNAPKREGLVTLEPEEYPTEQESV